MIIEYKNLYINSYKTGEEFYSIYLMNMNIRTFALVCKGLNQYNSITRLLYYYNTYSKYVSVQTGQDGVECE